MCHSCGQEVFVSTEQRYIKLIKSESNFKMYFHFFLFKKAVLFKYIKLGNGDISLFYYIIYLYFCLQLWLRREFFQKHKKSYWPQFLKNSVYMYDLNCKL